MTQELNPNNEDLLNAEVIEMNKFIPRDYQLEFVSAMESGGYKKAVLAWPRRCARSSDWVLLSNGSTKKMRDIKVGDKILSWNGKEIEEDTVKNFWKTEPKKTRTLKAGKFLPVTTSLDHRFAVVNPQTENVYWREAGELNEMSHFLMNYSGLAHGKPGDPDLAEFIGYMSSDGGLGPNYQPSFTNKNIEILDRVEHLASKLFSSSIRRTESRAREGCFTLSFNKNKGEICNRIRDFFESNGQNIQKKYRKMNPLVWEMDFQTVKRYFAGIISGDGSLYVHDKGFVSIDRGRTVPPSMELSIHCGINDEFGWDMYWLLRKFGIVPRVPKKERGTNWKIRVSNSAGLYKLLNDNYIYGKNDIALRILNNIRKHDFNKKIKGCYKSKITKITENDKEEELYDLETERNHNFFSNGYLVHNCIFEHTRVSLSDGSTRQIKHLKKGDKILSFDGKNVVTDTVKDVWDTGEKEVIDLKVFNAPAVTTTLDHRFLSNINAPAVCIVGKGSAPVCRKAGMLWEEAKDVKTVYIYKRGVLKRVAIDRKSESYIANTYDIETENHHNFFANGYLVHNSGKDICAWNLLVRAAVREIGSYIYCLPTFSMCRRVLLNSKLHDGSSFMDFIPKKLVKAFNQQEMKITLINGSIIIMIGSDNAKERVVGMAAKGLVISEAALASPIGISYLQPMITASDGFIIFISCVAPDTIVVTDSGLKRIKDISTSREEYTDLNKGIFGLKGFHNATDFYYGGTVPTLKIKLSSGFEIECSRVHKLWTGSKWKKSVDFKVGDYLPIQYNQQVFGKGLDLSEFNYEPDEKDPFIYFPFSLKSADFFYLLGLIHGDGSYDKNKVTIINKKDVEIQDFIKFIGFMPDEYDGTHFSYESQLFPALLEFLGFKHGARNKEFPDKLLEGTKEQLKAFIQGLFDSDGSNSNKDARVHIDSACAPFIKTLQVVLLNFGIVSSLGAGRAKPIKKVGRGRLKKKVMTGLVVSRLIISGYFAHIFYESIGFRLHRKQERKHTIKDSMKKGSGNTYPVRSHRLKKGRIKKGRQLLRSAGQEGITRRELESLHAEYSNDKYLGRLLEEEFYYSKIVSITGSYSEVFDFVIPETHSFFSNGFISHNTPRSENKFWELYNVATSSDKWYSSKLTINDTKHVPLERIQADIDSGIMSYELAQQEWWTSFTSLNEGAYYSKYVDKMEINDQFTTVPYEPSLQTYCFMDIGMDDMFVILFVQITSMTIRIFDYYENNSEGLEHYANLMKSKGYGQIIVYAPHDIKVRELSTGTSRLEKLRSLMPEVNVVPLSGVNDGIEAVRTILPKTYIDNKKCEKMVKAIKNYTREWDEVRQTYKNKPNHNKYCFLGFHRVLTPKGEVSIRDIKVGDEVITPLGVRKVTETHKRRARKFIDIDIWSNWTKLTTITTTAGHKIFTPNGFTRAVSLHVDDKLEHYGKIKTWLWKGIHSINGDDLGFYDYIKNKQNVAVPSEIIAKAAYFAIRALNFLSGLIDEATGGPTVAKTHEYKTRDFHYVYDITVDVDHCYYIDGYLVSNSHANDALRYLAVSHKNLGNGMTAEELDERYNNAMRQSGSNLPKFFQ